MIPRRKYQKIKSAYKIVGKGYAPFRRGDKVLAVDALPKARIINDTEYIVKRCHCKVIKAAGKVYHYWYVGVYIHGFDNSYMRNSIFKKL